MLVYVDSSVVMAHLLNEPRRPVAGFWAERLTASRLLEYEVRVRLNAYGHADLASAAAPALLAHVGLIALDEDVLDRALRPLPLPVRTLDALHLATLDHLRSTGGDPVLATYDQRMAYAALAMGFTLHADARPAQ